MVRKVTWKVLTWVDQGLPCGSPIGNLLCLLHKIGGVGEDYTPDLLVTYSFTLSIDPTSSAVVLIMLWSDILFKFK